MRTKLMSTITGKQMSDTKTAEEFLDTMLKSGLKFCDSCVHFVENMGYLSLINQKFEGYCTHPMLRTRSGVDGAEVTQCKLERSEQGICGLLGRLFEPYPENVKLRELIISKEKDE